MIIHTSRDFSNANNNIDYHSLSMYCLVIFLKNVMNYTIVGSTNLDLTTIGGTWLSDSGTDASINQGSPDRYAVSIPVGQYVVTASDIDRTLVLTSNSNERENSGLFRITTVDTINNWVYIDFRSPDDPTIESGMNWAIYENEEDITFTTTDNGAGDGTYETQGAGAAATRIILESPNGWQVRVCKEGSTDSGNFLCKVSVALGINGDTLGDFSTSGEHMHIAQFYDRTSSDYRNTVVGLGGGTNNTPSRVYIWGDTSTDVVTIIWRDSGGGNSGICIFGFTEDPESPAPEKLIQKLFVYGGAQSGEKLLLLNIASTDNGGCAFGLSNRPISCTLGQYMPLSLTTTQYDSITNGAPMFRIAAADSVFLKQAELLHMEVIVGTFDNQNSLTSNATLPTEVRRIGTCPLVRVGRANLGDFQVTTDSSRSWIHMSNGIYLPWEGPRILP